MKEVLTMKKAMMMVLVLMMMMVGVSANAECDLYADTWVVYEVDYETDTVWCMDFVGNVWSFSECEDWAVGDLCSVLLNTNGTEVVRDDSIVSVTYGGWVDGNWGWGNNRTPLATF
jgi:hypothetical protein